HARRDDEAVRRVLQGLEHGARPSTLLRSGKREQQAQRVGGPGSSPWCRRLEVPTPIWANLFRRFKSKSGTRIIDLLVPPCFLSWCWRLPRWFTNFAKRGTRAFSGKVDPVFRRKCDQVSTSRPLSDSTQSESGLAFWRSNGVEASAGLGRKPRYCRNR